MTSFPDIPHPLKREGTHQSERFPEALHEDYVRLDERDLLQLVRQSAEYAAFVQYHNSQNSLQGSWKPFYEEVYDYANGKVKFNDIAELETKAATSPHLALFLSFLRLFGLAQENLNTLTRKHLHYYYTHILRLAAHEMQPDKVTIFFENEKNSPSVMVRAGSRLTAGKDSTGKERIYQTLNDLIANLGKVEALKTLFVRKDAGGAVCAIHRADNAAPENVINPAAGPAWYGFGSAMNARADVGFVVASPLLNLKEGDRRITLKIDGLGNLPLSNLKVEFTGEKGWEQASAKATEAPAQIARNLLFIEIPTSAGAVLPYNEKVHKAGLNTIHPALRFLISNTVDSSFAAAFKAMSNIRVNKAEIITQVDGVHDLVLQTDTGLVNNTKPFLPFGARPVKGKSSFYIGSNDVFNKYLKSFNLAMEWKGMPGNMVKYYRSWEPALELMHPGAAIAETQKRNKYFNTGQFSGFVPGHPPGKVSVLTGGQWKELKLNVPSGYSSYLQLDHYTRRKATRASFRNVFKPRISDGYSYDKPGAFGHQTKSGFVRIGLGYDFGHAQYPYLYTYAVMKASDNPAQLEHEQLPKTPYTPEINSIHVDYTAADAFIPGTAGNVHQIFQLHPFGNRALASAGDPIIPAFDEEGQLLIGLSGFEEPKSVSIHFHLDNDAVNPDRMISAANRMQWGYLKGNEWVGFRDQEILLDSTQRFSGSGIVHFAIPAAALAPTTQMPAGLVWIRGTVPQESDAYPPLLGVRAQAVEAIFTDNGNETSHLSEGLPPQTISKLLPRIPGIKTVEQPFPSRYGRSAETDESFYTRVSERLRHKDRAWSLWDYERLVLEHFPEVARVKCIPHTNRESEYAPGHVLLVVLPQLPFSSRANVLQPGVSKSVLERIRAMLAERMPVFVQPDVINPVYEALSVNCQVKLKTGYADVAYYRDQLNEGLKNFIAPWILNQHNRPLFGGGFYKSQIINFIEEEPYVDFITHFEVTKHTPNGTVQCGEMITGSNERVILTSVLNHSINIL